MSATQHLSGCSFPDATNLCPSEHNTTSNSLDVQYALAPCRRDMGRAAAKRLAKERLNAEAARERTAQQEVLEQARKQSPRSRAVFRSIAQHVSSDSRSADSSSRRFSSSGGADSSGDASAPPDRLELPRIAVWIANSQAGQHANMIIFACGGSKAVRADLV